MAQLEKDLKRLLQQTTRVRQLQREYFRTRSKYILGESKREERDLDKILEILGQRYPEPPPPPKMEQGRLL